jgi:hypothetical protein
MRAFTEGQRDVAGTPRHVQSRPPADMNDQRRGNGYAVVLVGLLALVGCGGKPTLVLQWKGLPAEASGLSVRLSSPTWSFDGADSPGGPVSVAHPGGGVVEIGVDRAYLAAHGDRLRLGLAVPARLPVQAVAGALVGGSSRVVEASGTAAPDQDLLLRFDFTQAHEAGDGGADQLDAAPVGDVAIQDGPGPAADVAGREGATLAGDAGAGAEAALPDAAVERTAPADTAVERTSPMPDLAPPDEMPPPDSAASPDTAPPVDHPPPTCTLGPLRAASVSMPSGSPSIAYAGGFFGVAWVDADRILYNALDENGVLQKSADLLVVPKVAGQTLSGAALAAAGNRLALAYGRHDGTGATTALRLLTPGTGAGVGPAVAGVVGDGNPPDGGGVAASDDGTRIAVASRLWGLTATAWRVDLFDGAPALLASSPPPPATSFTTGVTWWPGHGFAAASISELGGAITVYAPPLADPSPNAFTTDSDRPQVGLAGTTVSVAAGGDRLAVAWIDGRPCPGCTSTREVYLALLDPATHAIVTSVHASAPTARPKQYPRLRFDGSSWVLAWSEYSSTSDSTVWLRRFDAALAPLGPPLDLSATSPKRPASPVDLAVVGPNEYAVVFQPFLDTHKFLRVSCTGP